MKISQLLIAVVILLAGCSAQDRRGFMGSMYGATLDGIVCGLTGADPETQNYYTNAYKEQGAMRGLQIDALKLGVDLNKIPPEWMPQSMADVKLKKRADGNVCYYLGDDHLVWDPINKTWMTED
jgi:hypothetical protein